MQESSLETKVFILVYRFHENNWKFSCNSKFSCTWKSWGSICIEESMEEINLDIGDARGLAGSDLHVMIVWFAIESVASIPRVASDFFSSRSDF